MEELRNGQSCSLWGKVSFNHRQGERGWWKEEGSTSSSGVSVSQYDTVLSSCTPHMDSDWSDHSETFLHLTLSHNIMVTLPFPAAWDGKLAEKEGRPLKRTSVAESGSA